MLHEGRLAATIVKFCRFARSNDIPAGAKQTVDALEAARVVGIMDRSTLMAALRAVLCSSKEEWDLFDEIFRVFWNGTNSRNRIVAPDSHSKVERDLAPTDSVAVAAFGGQAAGKAADPDGRNVLGASKYERLSKVDFSEVSQSDVADLERISLRLLRRMALRLARRLKRKMRSRGPVDIRRTIRLNISKGGDPLELRYKTRRRDQNRLVLLVDVSGSMNAYSFFLLRFAYALQKHFRRVNTFLFSTRLTDITATLRSRSLRQSLPALSHETIGWSGGTKIGESLRELLLAHGGRLLSRNTLFVMLSDGWDTGEPQVLAAELGAIQRRVKKIIWLNPLLGMEGYQPITRGMAAALPHIDVFAPAHNLESLLQLDQHLSRPGRG